MRSAIQRAIHRAIHRARRVAAWLAFGPVPLAVSAQATPASPDSASTLAVPSRVRHELTPGGLTVGAPFSLVLTVRVAKGTEVGFPVGPDSGSIEALASMTRTSAAAGPDSVDERASYRLVAWNTGPLQIPMADVVLARGAEAEKVPVGALPVVVQSVLPKATDEREPKPARDLFGLPAEWWRDLIVVSIVAGLALLLLWVGARRIRTKPAARLAKQVDPLAALAALDGLALDRVGEPASLLIAAADAVREGLRQAEPTAASLTTDELATMRFTRPLPLARIVALLEAADAAKFSRAGIAAERARAAVVEARALVLALQQLGTAA